MMNDTFNIKKITTNAQLMKILEPEFVKAEFFGTICKFFQTIFKNKKMMKKLNNDKKFKDFLELFFYQNNNLEILDEDSISTFGKMATSSTEFIPMIVNFQFSYLYNRGNKIGELSEREIASDINFFRLCMVKNFDEYRYEDFLYENTNYTLDIFDKMLKNSFSRSEKWQSAFFKIFIKDKNNIFDIPELGIYYFLRKILEILPKINNLTMENVKPNKKLLKIIEAYLFFVSVAISDIDDECSEEKHRKIYNIITNICLYLLPILFRFKQIFKITCDPKRDIKKIKEDHNNMELDIPSILDVIWNELIYLLTFSLKKDDDYDGELTTVYLNHTAQIDTLNNKYYKIVYLETTEIRSGSNNFHKELVRWKPKIGINKPSDYDEIEYCNMLIDFTKDLLASMNYNFITSLYLWIGENNLQNNDLDAWTTEKTFGILEGINLNEDDADDLVISEKMIASLLSCKPEFEKRNIKIINRLILPESVFSNELASKLIEAYNKNFDCRDVVKYKGVFANTDFVNKLIRERNFSSFIRCDVIDISLYYVNHIFIESKDYLRLYIFVLESLTYMKIETDSEKLSKIILDPKKLSKNQEISTEMKIDCSKVPKYVKRVLNSSRFDKMSKINFCIAMLKYLSSCKTIIKTRFYAKILKFALKKISKKDKDNINIQIKVLIHLLLEGPYDVMKKKNLFDAHLTTYESFLEDNRVLGFTNINGLRAKYERKLCNLDYMVDNSPSDYKYVLKMIHEKLFKKLLKLSLRNINALNITTEILINNPRYAIYITEKFIAKIIIKHIITVELTDKIFDNSDFEVSVKFLVACLKSNYTTLQADCIIALKKALEDCSNNKLYNILIVLFRSIDFIDVVEHEDDVYVTSNKLNELSGKYINASLMNIIIKKLTICSEEDLTVFKTVENIVFKDVDSCVMKEDKNWNNYDSKLAYVYKFLSTTYNNYFKTSNRDNSKEIWNTEIKWRLFEHDLPKRKDYDVSDDVDSFKINDKANMSEYKNNNSHHRIDSENVFNRIYLSYWIYKKDYDSMPSKRRVDLICKMENRFEKDYNIEKFNGLIQKTDINNIPSWEQIEFINLSEFTPDQKVDPILDTTGIKNGIIPEFNILQLESWEIFILKKSVEDWNNRRLRLYDEYLGIDIDFLNGCNKEHRDIFIKEEEKLKLWYTRNIDQTYLPAKKTIVLREGVPARSYNEYGSFDLSWRLADRFDDLTQDSDEKHDSVEFLNILNWRVKPLFVRCEDRLAKINLQMLYMKEKKTIDRKTNIESDVIFKFLVAFPKKYYLCHSEISKFLGVLCSYEICPNLLLASLERTLLSLCQRSVFSISEVKSALIILSDQKWHFSRDKECDIYFIRLLLILSRFPELCTYTISCIGIYRFDIEYMTRAPFLDKFNNLNPMLISIPEDDISGKLLWNFKELLKNNIPKKDYTDLLQFLEINLKSCMLDLVFMCLHDSEVLGKSMEKVLDLCVIYFKFVERKNSNKIYDLRKVHDLQDILISEMDFSFLRAKGLFLDDDSKFEINSEIYDLLHELIQSKNFKPKNFMIMFEIYEGFINYLSICKTSDKPEKIESYLQLRLQLEKEMMKEKEIYNAIFRSDIKRAPFLAKFNLINFTNKRKFFRDKIRSEFPKDSHGIIELSIDRDLIVADSYDVFMEESVKRIKYSKIMVDFQGEDGIDEGGLTKEWLECLAKGLANQDFGLFTYSSDKQTTLQPFKGSGINIDHLKYFQFVGRVIGKTIIDGYNFPLNLDKTVYKFILNKKCDLSDLESVDPQFYNSLIWMRDNSIQDVLHLTFTYENNDFGEFKVEDLKPDGRNIQVTDENKNEYIDLTIQKKFINSIHDQLNALKRGLTELVTENLLFIFDEKELELLICGVPEIDVEDWKRNTNYSEYNKNSQNIIWFWQAVSGFSADEKAKLLYFCTGSSRVPYDGFANLQSNNGHQRFKIHKMNGKRLPTAHTCVNQLDLPEYSTYEELRKNILYAINECHGGYGFA